ncbi:FecR family protein [Flavivirga algicola]|uniref:FecR family protein n=1 Tax=Flavivirga algicola TaxID=2729136 RepID=A0ABX1RVQ2_9FLAO|nr:FecR family protein [Flavivirga algicola]NMH86848.1 FecR family protein [Flavivirga algicola]
MKQSFWELVTKYLSNEISEDDLNTLFVLLENNGDNKKAFDSIAKKWKETGDLKATTFNAEKAKHKVLSQIKTKPQESKLCFYETYQPVLKIAATVIILLGVYFAYNLLGFHETWKEFRTVNNEKLRVLLPDSSIVWLNENSVLSYNFSNPETRQIALKGEAFFDVARNEEKPFVVSSPNFTTTVLGTSFNIDSKGKKPSVSVIEGKVAVNKKESEQLYLLEKGDKAIYDIDSKKLSKEHTNGVENEMAWVDRKFIFDDTPLEKALEYLSQNYHVTFQLKNENLKNCYISGTFHKVSLKKILKLICTSLDGEYTITTNNLIAINGDGCEKKPEDTGNIYRLKTN